MREKDEVKIVDIRDFFKLNVQAQIINAAQNYNNIYEETISEFAKLFYAKLCQCISNTDTKDKKNEKLVFYTKKFLDSEVSCNIGNIEELKDQEEMRDKMIKNKRIQDMKIQDVVKVSSLAYFFQKIICCYKCWCTCDLSGALQIVEKILKKTGNKSVINIKNGDVFYRGRITETNIDKSDMFHIPFKKSYLIKNQRFSVTGQPVLYITDKLPGLINELGLKNENEEKISRELYISRFEYNDLNKNLNIFDFRIEKKELDFEEYDRFEEYMYRFMISCVCSFPAVHKGEYFVEEYIMPQLFTQVARKEYDGVCYQNINSVDYDNYVNYVLFTTKKRVDSSIDETLRKKFYISSPITAKMIKDKGFLKQMEKENALDVLKTHFDSIDQNKKIIKKQEMSGDIVENMRTFFDGKSTYIDIMEDTSV